MFESSEVSNIYKKVDGREISSREATASLLELVKESTGREREEALRLLSDVVDTEVLIQDSDLIIEAYEDTDNYRVMRDILRCIYECIKDDFYIEDFLRVIQDATIPRVENMELTNVEYLEIHRISSSKNLEETIQQVSGKESFELVTLDDYEKIDEEGRIKSKRNIIVDEGKIGIVTKYSGRNTLKVEIVREMEKQRISSSSEETRLSNAFNSLTKLIQQGKIRDIDSDVVSDATEIVSTLTRQNVVLVVAEFLSYCVTKVQDDMKRGVVNSFLQSVNQVHGRGVLHYLEEIVVSCKGDVPREDEIERTIRKLRGIEIGLKVQVVPPSEQDLKTAYAALSYLAMESELKRKLVSIGLLKP